MTAKHPNSPPPPGSRRPSPPPNPPRPSDWSLWLDARSNPPPMPGVQPARPWPRCYAGLVNGCECPRCKDAACDAGERRDPAARDRAWRHFPGCLCIECEHRAGRHVRCPDPEKCRDADMAAACNCDPIVALAPGHQHAPRPLTAADVREAFEDNSRLRGERCNAGTLTGCACARCRQEAEELATAMRHARLVAAQLGQPPSPWPLWAVLAIALTMVGACMGAGAAIGVWWAGWHG
jgi:hypothetical protein